MFGWLRRNILLKAVEMSLCCYDGLAQFLELGGWYLM